MQSRHLPARRNSPPIMIAEEAIGAKTVPAVDARVLWEALGIKKDFSNWVKTHTESSDWIENVDFGVFAQKGENPQGGRPSTEYILSIQMAEHIAMMTRTKKGREVREYFRRARDERDAMQRQGKLAQPQSAREALMQSQIALHQAMDFLRHDVETVQQDMGVMQDEVRALKERHPPQGKSTVHEWLRRHHKPFLPQQVMTQLKAECQTIEEPESFRPEGFEYPFRYYSPYTIATAYDRVTRQLSFFAEKAGRYTKHYATSQP